MAGCALYTAKKSTVHLGALAEKLGWLGWTKVRGANIVSDNYWPTHSSYELNNDFIEISGKMGTTLESCLLYSVAQTQNSTLIFSVTNVAFFNQEIFWLLKQAFAPFSCGKKTRLSKEQQLFILAFQYSFWSSPCDQSR